MRCTPLREYTPTDEPTLARIVRSAAYRGRHVRPVGTGHSSSALVECSDYLLSLKEMQGVVRVDAANLRATVRPGTALAELGRRLYEHDLAMPNYGDIATQTIAGAIGTGTHGTGLRQQILSAQLIGARLVDGQGQIRTIQPHDTDLLHALRVSLGVLGVFSELTLQLVPSFDVERREYHVRTEEALAQFDRLAQGNRSFDLYWYPRRDDVKLRLVNPIGGGTLPSGAARLLRKHGGRSDVIIPAHSGIPHRFEECEYALPYAAGLACFAEVRERILRRWRQVMGWRVLVRTVAADDAWLSPAQGRDSITISLHQNSHLPWREAFADIEAVFRAHGGRPHWAKKHTMTSAQLAPLYPEWDRFLALRREFDPTGVFLSPGLKKMLGIDE